MIPESPFTPGGHDPLNIPWEPTEEGDILEFDVSDPETRVGMTDRAIRLDYHVELLDVDDLGMNEGTVEYYGELRDEPVTAKLTVEIETGGPKRSRLWIHADDVEAYDGTTNRVVDEWVHAGTIHAIGIGDDS